MLTSSKNSRSTKQQPESITITKMGIDNQSTWNQNCVCLPCTEKENYADLDAADQVNAQWEDYKKELKSFGLYRENLIHLIGKEIKDK